MNKSSRKAIYSGVKKFSTMKNLSPRIYANIHDLVKLLKRKIAH